MYRAVALAVLQSRVDPSDLQAVGALAESITIELSGDPDNLKVTLNGQDITNEIRSEEVTEVSSIISTIPAVRRAMVGRQREMGRRGAVLNGRDIGTVVFPDADIKFFLTASANERAQRRFREEHEQHPEIPFSETLADMTERDHRDSSRSDSPLKIADDAILIDSSGLSIDQVLQRMLAEVKEKQERLRTF